MASPAVCCPHLVYFMAESYYLPKLLSSSSLTVDMFWLADVKVLAAYTLPFLTQRLRDFFGLKFILPHDIKLSRRSNIPRVSASFEQFTVAPSIIVFRGDI